MSATLSLRQPVLRDPVTGVASAIALLCGGLLAWMYSPTVLMLVKRWDADPSWTHGYAVLAAFPFLLWRVAKQSGPPWQAYVRMPDGLLGLFTVATGLLWHFVGQIGVESLDAAGLVVVLFGLLWVAGGRVSARTFRGSVLFLLFMVPWPLSWQQPVAESLQHLVAVTSHGLLSLSGIPIHRVGNLLMLPGQTVEVAQGCNGLRQITVFLALSVFLGMIGGDRARGWALLALSLPTAILANTLRIALTVVILMTAGPAWATGVFHECEGLVTFAIGFGLLWSAANFLKRIGSSRGGGEAIGSRTRESSDLCLTSEVSRLRLQEKSQPRDAVLTVKPERAGSSPVVSGLRTLSVSGLTLRVRLAALAVVLVIAAGLDGALQRAIAAPGRITTIGLERSLAAFPTELGDWSGADTPVQNPSFLYGDEHLHRVYRHRRSGQTLTLWMIYTEDGRDRSHHPEVCMRAIGCVEDRDQRAALPVDGHDQPVQRFYFRNPSGRAGQLIYYWYYVFREAASDQPRTAWQRLLEKGGRMRSGMTVEIFAPQLADGDAARTDEFTRQLDRALQTHLPARAVRGSLRGSYVLVRDGGIVESAPP